MMEKSPKENTRKIRLIPADELEMFIEERRVQKDKGKRREKIKTLDEAAPAARCNSHFSPGAHYDAML